MSAPHHSAGEFLKKASVRNHPEAQIEKIAILQANLPAGTRVFIALLDPSEVEKQIEACVALRAAGFEPIPHIPARFVKDEEDLKTRVAAFTSKAKVNTILALGGGAPNPIGKFDAAIQLMNTGVFEAHGIKRMGIAGHPEGNNDITKPHGQGALLQALKEKQAWLKSKNIEGFIATQFLFEAGPLALWVEGLRKQGIEFPVFVGVHWSGEHQDAGEICRPSVASATPPASSASRR